MNHFKTKYPNLDISLMIKQWLKAGIFLNTCFLALFLGFSKKGLEILRLAIQYKTQESLRKRFKYVLTRSENYDYKSLTRIQSNKVWVCWFQGVEKAPLLVHRCIDSLRKNLLGKEIIILTSDNIGDYVTFPDYIMTKWERGIITNTHFSDLLRLEILIKYGGTWIDSTVMATNKNIPEYMFNSELFFFQILKPGKDGHAIGLSSWFLSSTTNNKILLITRDLLYEYWKKNNLLVDYYLFHSFMEIALAHYPEEYQKVIKSSNSAPHILLLDIFEKYDQQRYNYIKEITCFHKLSNKLPIEDTKKKGTFFDILINEGRE